MQVGLKKLLFIFILLSFAFPVRGEYVEVGNAQKEEVFIPGEVLVQYKNENSPQELQEISQNAYLFSLDKQLELIEKLSNSSAITPTTTEQVLGVDTKKLLAQSNPVSGRRSRTLPPNFNGVATLKNIAQSKERFVTSYLEDNKITVKSFSKSPLTRQYYYQYKIDTGQNQEETIKELQSLDEVAIAQPNYLYHTLKVPNDPEYSSLWGMKKIQAEKGWDIFTGSKANVKVGVIDQLPNLSHPDLADNVVKYKNMCSSGGASGGHGNHVSGTIGAIGNNGKGVAGVNWEASIAGYNVECSGKIPSAALVKAVDEAVADKVRVINMSLGGPADQTDQLFKDAIKRAVDGGVLVVVSAGNCGSTPSRAGCGSPAREISADNLYPASDPNVFTVAATGQNDERAPFSSKGTSVDITAPGVGVISTWVGGGYQSSSGTSMSSPHVAGLATLIFAKNPNLSVSQVRQIIVETADDLGAPGRDDIHGAGRINVAKALAHPSVGNSQNPGSPIPTNASTSSSPVPSQASLVPTNSNPTPGSSFVSPTATQITSIPNIPKLEITPGVPIKIPLPTPSGARSAVESFTFFEPCSGGYKKLDYTCSDGKSAKLQSSECQPAEVHVQKAINACAVQNDDGINPTIAPSDGIDARIELSEVSFDTNGFGLIDVLVDSGGKNILGVDVVLNYNSALLEIINIKPVKTEGFIKMMISKYNQDGSVYISGLIEDEKQIVNGRGVFAQIAVKAINKSAYLDITCVQGQKARDSNISENTINVKDLINCSKNINWRSESQKFEETRIKFQTRLQGVNNPLSKTLTLQVGVGGGRLEDPIFKSVIASHVGNGVYKGEVDFNLVNADNYSFYIKGPVHQRRKFCQNNPKEIFKGVYSCLDPKISLIEGINELDFSSILVLVGDLPDSEGVQDGIVNSRDIAQLRSAIDLKNEVAPEFCDLNFDGACNATDWSLLLAALSVKGDEN